jgi:hypothetical protein
MCAVDPALRPSASSALQAIRALDDVSRRATRHPSAHCLVLSHSDALLFPRNGSQVKCDAKYDAPAPSASATAAGTNADGSQKEVDWQARAQALAEERDAAKADAASARATLVAERTEWMARLDASERRARQAEAKLKVASVSREAAGKALVRRGEKIDRRITEAPVSDRRPFPSFWTLLPYYVVGALHGFTHYVFPSLNPSPGGRR